MMSMNTLWTLAIAALLGSMTVLPRFLKYRASERKAKLKLIRTAGTEMNVALTMHPQIKIEECIGCGSCVRACPEGDVLGIIGGKATLIHGAKCVGHALCAEECPVGAITMALAAPGRSANLPILDEYLQTNLPGLYIAGELGGMGLIRNAIGQGIRTVQHLSAQLPSYRNGHLDVLIVGAGPAGLAAALTAKSQGLKFAVLEQGDIGGTILQYPRRKIVMTAPVELPLYGKIKLNETSKESLLGLWEKIISKTQLAIRTNEKVLEIQKNDTGYLITSPSAAYEAYKVVLAIGRRGTPRKLGVPGENLSKVCYRLIEAESYQNCDLLVVGGGDSAIEAAVALASQSGNRVTLSYRKSEFSRIKDRNEKHIQEYSKQRKVNVVFDSEVKEISEDHVLLNTSNGTKEIANQYVFVFAGGEMPYDFLRKTGIAFHAQAV
jgi:putative YpdA family bacillithiol system oxidoreductase